MNKLIYLILVISAIALCGCTSNAPSNQISIAGSTTMLPLISTVAEEYMIKNDVDIQISGGGSSIGIKSVGEGLSTLGMTSRDLKVEELEAYPYLIPIKVATDGIAIIINPENPIKSLSLSEIKDIYSGKITTWEQLGGTGNITIIGRDSASGTREFIYEYVMNKEDFTINQIEKNSNNGVLISVAQTLGGIGYISIGYIDKTIKPIMIETDSGLVSPSLSNVETGTYPLSRPLYIIENQKEIKTDEITNFINYFFSNESNALITTEGFIPAIN